MDNSINANLKYITFTKGTNTVIVKNGFSWTAFFFGFWVYLYRKMWGSFALWLVVGLIFITLSLGANGIAESTGDTRLASVIFLIRILYSVYQGATINKNYMFRLKMQGYV
ncbi:MULTISPECIES: DUF2628 domain-containing protein [Enterobacterales]|jgi:hypothetical protein|uniref:DUF2628 domain-containing protein n=4 Tax=Providencia TaxID=586 RepID=A0A899NFW1_PROST|nr:MULTISPECIES: DUF2628 domain-containing protein [Morganellaceae]EKH6498571.1 DUF2628 domain-containing protein [Providencia rettgeri]ELB1111398.1 DUF2628 domain-containing protein [Morganella morganii]ELL8907242.1 DUF2628 domain-containing protein [Proteus mirabilis]MBQ0270704.1 DUF2628 domain-containing protein [Providencia huaxiensis]MCO4187931.1 DUF2628 domain-containing protein [Proteus terrae]QHP74605.1 DUF2628 domain-containing protein [Proteus vulgaris]